MPNDEISFCPYCGVKLDKGAKFCKSCGKPIQQYSSKSETPSDEQNSENPTQRKTVYEGYIHKCPNCGEVLESFKTDCPSCGYEIRSAQSSGSVKELAKKLELIESKQMPAFQGKRSIMKTLIGKDLHGEDEEDEARKRFEQKKREQESNLIINFSVPNTREDIMEFILLASSNINVKCEKNSVTDAWISKLEQVYQRAEFTMLNSPDFAQIKYIYDKKMNEIHKHKMEKFYKISAIVIGWVLLMTVLVIIAVVAE